MVLHFAISEKLFFLYWKRGQYSHFYISDMLKRLLLTLLVVIAAQQRTLAVTYFTVSSYNTEQTIIGAEIDEATRKLIEENSSRQGEIRTYTLLLQRGLQGIYSIKQECDSENSPKYIKSGNIEIITAEELNYDMGTAKYTYMDLTTSEQISSRIVLEKEFLVQETLKPKNWIIGTETKRNYVLIFRWELVP